MATLAAPQVVIVEDANDDGVIGSAELQGDIDVRITLPASAVAGDVLTATDGVTVQTVTLTAQQVATGWGMTSFAPPPEGSWVTVDAFLTDAAGNDGATGSDSAMRHTEPGVVILDDVNDDHVLCPAELAGDIHAHIALPADLAPGQAITVQAYLGLGVQTQTFGLTAEDIATGSLTRSFTPPPDGSNLFISAWLVDEGGPHRFLQGQDWAVRYTAGPTSPGVVIVDDSDGNGMISSTELREDIDVRITLPPIAAAGDVITVTDGSAMRTLTLTAADVATGWGMTSFALPPDGDTITVSAYLTDPAGHQGEVGSASAVRHTTVPNAPVVVITQDRDNDGVIRSGELDDADGDGDFDVWVGLPAGVEPGDRVDVSAWYVARWDRPMIGAKTVVLTPELIAAGGGTIEFPAPRAWTNFVVSASVRDHAGSVSMGAQDSAAMLFSGVVPVYTVLLANGDRFYSSDAKEAARMALGAENVLEGAQFDLGAASFDYTSPGAWPFVAYHQPFTGDWFFGGAGAVFGADGRQPTPYECYELDPQMHGFTAWPAAGHQSSTVFHTYLNAAGLTQFATEEQATQAGLVDQGYVDAGAAFAASTRAAFVFDAEGYLLANRDDANIQALVQALAGNYASTSDAGFVETVEQDYLARVQFVGIAHGDAATVADLNAAFGTRFAA